VSYVIIAILVFSIFDYRYYNVIGKKDEFKYRVIQVSFQIILSVILFLINPIYAICFLLVWWTWGCDWIYYLIDFALWITLKRGYEGGDGFKRVLVNGCNWGWWTPYGLVKLLFTGSRDISGRALIAQSLVGLLVVDLIFKYF